MKFCNKLFILFLLIISISSIKQLQQNFPFQKNLWLYWHDNIQAASPIIRLCYQKFIQICKKSEFQLILLNRTNLNDYISNIDEKFYKVLNQTKQTAVANIADLVRLLVLEEHGGIWVDISSIFFQGFYWLFDLMNGKYDQLITNKFVQKPQALLFYYGNYQNRIDYRIQDPKNHSNKILYNEYPGYQIWFIAVKKQCQFIKDLRITYSQFTKKNYDQLEHVFIKEDIFIHNQDDGGNYLAQNMAATYIMQKKQKQLDKNLPLNHNQRYNVFQYYKIWGLHGELGPLSFSRKQKATQHSCFDKTIEEIRTQIMPLYFYVKIVHTVRVLFDQKLALIEDLFVKPQIKSIEQFIQTKPSLQVCQNLRLIVNGSVISKLLQNNKIQNQILKLPIFSVQERKKFQRYCFQLNGNKQLPYNFSDISFFETFISSRGQRAKLEEVDIKNKPKNMGIIQWIKYEWNINSFMLKIIYIIGNFIIILSFILYLAFILIRKIFFSFLITKKQQQQIQNNISKYQNSNKIRSNFKIYILNFMTFFISISYYLVVDIFGGKDQPLSIFFVVLIIFLLQIQNNKLKKEHNIIVRQQFKKLQYNKGYKPIQLSPEQVEKGIFSSSNSISSKINSNKFKDQASSRLSFQYLLLLNQISTYLTYYFTTYLTLGVVRKHKFLQMYYSFLFGLIGPFLFKIISNLNQRIQSNKSKGQILKFLYKISKQDNHQIIILSFLLVINILPNSKYIVSDFILQKYYYFLSQLVLFIPAIYLIFIGLYVAYQLISQKERISDLLRFILVFVIVCVVNLEEYKLIIILTQYRIVRIIVFSLVISLFSIQIGSKLQIFQKQRSKSQSSSNYKITKMKQILLYFGFIIIWILFGTLYYNIENLATIGIIEIFFIIFNISSIIIYQQINQREQNSKQILQKKDSFSENTLQFTDYKERKK